jgi:hypothetical protein
MDALQKTRTGEGQKRGGKEGQWPNEIRQKKVKEKSLKNTQERLEV